MAQPSSTSGSTGVRIWWDVDACAYRMQTPYSEAFLGAFKATFPAHARVWDTASRTWVVSEAIISQVAAFTEMIFKQKPSITTRQQTESAASQKRGGGAANGRSPIENAILDFVKLMPYESLQKAYRHAAMTLHPDKGGDMEKMTAINAAWGRIEKEVYKK